MSKHHIRESATLVILRVVMTFLFISFVYSIFLIIFLSANLFTDITINLLIILFTYIVLTFFAGAFILSLVIRSIATDYYISEHSLVLHTGLFKVDEQVYELKNIYAIRRSQSWFGKIFKYGDLIINIAASNFQKEFRLRGIQKPKKYAKILEEFIAKQKDETPPAVETQKPSPTT